VFKDKNIFYVKICLNKGENRECCKILLKRLDKIFKPAIMASQAEKFEAPKRWIFYQDWEIRS